MKNAIIAFAMLLSTSAFAQQPASPAERALGEKLMEEINSGINLRAQIAKLQDQIKELEAKIPAEPKKEGK